MWKVSWLTIFISSPAFITHYIFFKLFLSSFLLCLYMSFLGFLSRISLPFNCSLFLLYLFLLTHNIRFHSLQLFFLHSFPYIYRLFSHSHPCALLFSHSRLPISFFVHSSYFTLSSFILSHTNFFLRFWIASNKNLWVSNKNRFNFLFSLF